MPKTSNPTPTTDSSLSAPLRYQLFLFLLGSGFSALIYEILWVRYFSLILGGELLAISMVTATFMAGLALGSILLGRISDRSNNPLRLYAVLEFCIAISALLFPLALHSFSPYYLNLTSGLAANSGSAHLLDLGFSLLLILFPATCIGGTLPVICRLFSGQQFAQRVGRLYAFNTVGAVFGCLLSGFLLIPALGLSWTNSLAVTINFTIGLLAYLQSKNSAQNVAEATNFEKAPLSAEKIFLCTTMAVVGLCTLAYEILWSRLFILFLGNTTYAFSTILGVFLTGLSIGAWVYSRFLKQISNQARLLFILCLLLAGYLLISIPFYDQFAYLADSAHRWAGIRWWLQAGCSFMIVALAVLPPTLLSGALFPTAIALYAPRTGHFGEGTGILLFCNTCGAILGSCLASLYLIAAHGLHKSFTLVAYLNLLMALIILLFYASRIKRIWVAPLLAIAIFSLALPDNWNKSAMSSGPYYYHYGEKGGLRNTLADYHRLLDYREGREASVAVFEKKNGTRMFRVNGKTDGGSDDDMLNQILLGQLPLLFHPEPKKAMVIGLGTGVTLAQVATADLATDVAEISPAVVAISDFFLEQNKGALTRPNVKLHLRDGRNLLLTGTETFDLIISEPSNPWQTGNANLFTEEFYQVAARHLNQGGIFCQWLPIYDLPPDSLRTAIATFMLSFPDTLLFAIGSDVILLGRRIPSDSQAPWIAPRDFTAQSLQILEPFQITNPRDLLNRYLFADSRTLKQFSRGAPINSDYRPRLEFILQTGWNYAEENQNALKDARKKAPPQASIKFRLAGE